MSVAPDLLRNSCAARRTASGELEAIPVVRPNLRGVAALVGVGLGLLGTVCLGHLLMVGMATAPSSRAGAAPPPARSAKPAPPPPAAAPPMAAALPPAEAAREVALPAPPPMAAAALQPRTRAVAKRMPPVEAPAPLVSPADLERQADAAIDSLTISEHLGAVPAASGARAAPGTLRINSLPWAHVFLDGRWLGNTPLRGVSVPAGPHSLKLVNRRFSMVKNREIEVVAGEVLTVVEVLEVEYANK